MDAINTTDLTRIYKVKKFKKSPAKTLLALDKINFQVRQGELFGLLGPNGAGKTTLIKILTTLLAPTSGVAEVMGFDVNTHAPEIRQKINMVSGGESSGYGLLTVRENLWMFSQFYGIPTKQANQKILELLKIVGLSDRANTKSSELSTGLRQKMNIVRGFMTDPSVLFLDEPTLGLDVGASRDIRHFIRNWVNEDQTRTLLLTTHYMVEADELCDRVAIINQGKILACDSPRVLKQRLMQSAIYELTLNACDDADFNLLKQLPGVRQAAIDRHQENPELEIILEQDDALSTLIAFLTEKGAHILNLHKREATLEDVFVDLVGQSMKEVENAG